MVNQKSFEKIGNETDKIAVRLSYKIVELFSEGLYTSPNKAIEELVANSFDAGAQIVHVLLSSNLHDQDATIAVFDDGEGMDQEGLKRHWLIGTSSKRSLSSLPKNRQQIGKFGIGKLATYVLASRLTHISKCGGKYYSTSMDYRNIDRRVGQEVEPITPIKLSLLELTEAEAQQATARWINTKAFKATNVVLFGKGSSASWTLSIMSALKPKAHEVRPSTLGWVLRTALPLRPDFGIWLDGRALESSKSDKERLARWVLGKDLTELPRPSHQSVTISEDANADESSEHRIGLYVPDLGRITGYVEAYKDLLTGNKSDEIGRSHGFFVYVRGRLLNVDDGHFGISPDELRHGTFGRFRLVIHMDGLDEGLRSNREAIGDGPLLEAAKDTLRAIFNAVRPSIEKHDRDEAPGAKLARMLAASPTSLSRRPIVELSRSVAAGKSKSRYLIVPEHESEEEREHFFSDFEKRASEEAAQFITNVETNYDGSSSDGLAKFDTQSGLLRLNAWHPFVAAFYNEFTDKRLGQPLELLAMAEVLIESHLHAIGVRVQQIEQFLLMRDQLLRNLTNESGRQSALSLANALSESRNSPSRLEKSVCDAFRGLGFEVTPLGNPGEPDGVAAAHLSAGESGRVRRYKVALEAKSKISGNKVSAKDVSLQAVIRHRDKRECEHAIIVGPAFPTSGGDGSSLGEDIKRDREMTHATGAPKTITLITVDDLAKLVRLRPLKQVGLRKLRELFEECSLPEQSQEWVESIRREHVEKPPYREIVEVIEYLQKEFRSEPVRYSALRIELSHMKPPIKYESDQKLRELCGGMAQMAPGAIFAGPDTVELDQSAENVVAAIDTAMQDYPLDEQP